MYIDLIYVIYMHKFTLSLIVKTKIIVHNIISRYNKYWYIKLLVPFYIKETYR